MSKILIVSHQFLPHQSPRTTRWKMIYDELNNRGHEVMILTGTPQEEKNENITKLTHIDSKSDSKMTPIDSELTHLTHFGSQNIKNITNLVPFFFIFAHIKPNY